MLLIYYILFCDLYTNVTFGSLLLTKNEVTEIKNTERHTLHHGIAGLK